MAGETIAVLLDMLVHDAAQMQSRWKSDRDFRMMLVTARQALSTASRIHARVAAMNEAVDELKESQ